LILVIEHNLWKKWKAMLDVAREATVPKMDKPLRGWWCSDVEKICERGNQLYYGDGLRYEYAVRNAV